MRIQLLGVFKNHLTSNMQLSMTDGHDRKIITDDQCFASQGCNLHELQHYARTSFAKTSWGADHLGLKLQGQ